jgi:NDP-sugar pyrophosphorylase family protein
VLTIATHERSIKIDYGVLHVDGVTQRIRAYEEKPELASLVSMGVYVMEPSLLEYVPPDGPFDFPDLVHALLVANQPVGAYRHEGMWFDIGRQDDYEQAVQMWLPEHNGRGAYDGTAALNGTAAQNGNGAARAHMSTVVARAAQERTSGPLSSGDPGRPK